jgi:6-phosphogluconate dehydrogenase
MGNNIKRLLRKHGHECSVFSWCSTEIGEESCEPSSGTTLADFIHQLPKPRILWVIVPTSNEFSDLADQLLQCLEPDDIIIDNKNSYCQGSDFCAEKLKQHGIHYVDVGTSTSASNVKRGYCLMIGGDPDVVQYLEPIFQALTPTPKAKPSSAKSNLSNLKRKRCKVKPAVTHLYCGEAGAGHFARQFYEGVEESLMRAYAEVLAERDRPDLDAPIPSAKKPVGAHPANK